MKGKIMRRLAVLGLVLVAVSMLTGCSVVVSPGSEGIKVVSTGAKRGVDTTAATTGRIYYNPVNESIQVYPISWENYVFTASLNEGKQVDESISFNASGGAQITADVGVVYRVKPGRAPAFYLEYAKTKEEFLHGIMRNELRDALNREASKVPPTELMSSAKAEVLDKVKADLGNGPIGRYIEFQTISFVHSLRPDPAIMASINNVITATNNANAAIQAARGKMEAARGDSAQVLIRARGNAQANELLNASVTAKVLAWQFYQTWDGRVSVVGGSGTTLTQIPGSVFPEPMPAKK